MRKGKKIVIAIVISLIVLVLYGLDRIYKTEYNRANKAYLVYMNGEKLGLINDNETLYKLINQEQQAIKDKYNVDNVYPPDGFELREVNTFSDNFLSVEEIYKKIAEVDNFTVKGYIITIKFPEESKEDLIINVLDKNVFEEAIKKFVLAFITEDELKSHLSGEKKELTDIGSVINSMYFNETITIKEGYISDKAKIYLDVESLSQYLLFGENAEMINYTVKLGDNIESISEAYKLNPQEFIIANPTYRDTNTMLKVGSVVNVTLLNPVLTYIYEVYKIEETKIAYESKKIVDNTKPVGYSEITQAGVTGIRLNHENFQVKNGEQSSEVKIVDYDILREAVEEVIVVGPKAQSITGTYVDYGGTWGWPTLQPYVITSRYAMRWGKLHEGVDISGTGYGSPVYAVADGVVVRVAAACKSCPQWANGNYVVVKHDNDYYSAYLHLSGFTANVGDVVRKGDRIASMGQSGLAYGTHLHLGLYRGEPFAGGHTQSMDPCKTIFAGRC
ncbi:MAG: M23 family metallopeptidase [Bacilli bacterium]|nr:M23 family metallopeptidase [Bacilli bacterium]